ncbi:hypothetical protein H5410_061894 [Solanum commersonii]|uniref:Uncharacterized protein n=1 Tax=Solanum commersonii TaxID=4109 RepID=A0A9J5WAL1_SOLCO|nr:hypothetical protein H5410_061894 [Solanum commersonii]
MFESLTFPHLKLLKITPKSVLHGIVSPNDPEREDAEGNHKMTMKQKKAELPSHSAASTNFTERSASAIF